LDTNQTGQLKYTDINRGLKELSQRVTESTKNVGNTDNNQGNVCITTIVEDTRNHVDDVVESTERIDTYDDIPQQQVQTYLYILNRSAKALNYIRPPVITRMMNFSIGKRIDIPRIRTVTDM